MEESNSNNHIANNVARAIVAALDLNSTPDARKAAVSFLESIKTGDVRILASTSFVLVERDWFSEIRSDAVKMLQTFLGRIGITTEDVNSTRWLIDGDKRLTYHCCWVEKIKMVLHVVMESKMMDCGGREKHWKVVDATA